MTKDDVKKAVIDAIDWDALHRQVWGPRAAATLDENIRALPAEAQIAWSQMIDAGFRERGVRNGDEHRTHHWLAPTPEPLTTEQMKAVAVLQEYGFGPVANPR